MEIIQFPGRVQMIFDWEHWVRQLWMDGREHPKDLDPTWLGHSIVRWDSDTLVVDTIGLNDKTWIDAPVHPQTNALRVVERYRHVDQNTLEVDLTSTTRRRIQSPGRDSSFSSWSRAGRLGKASFARTSNVLELL